MPVTRTLRRVVLQLRRYLVAGLLIWVPLGVTILIIKLVVDAMDQTLLLLPEALRFRGLGIIVTAVVVIGTGIVVANLFGRQALHLGERVLNRIPLVGAIYGSVKKLTETLFSGSGKSFRKVVLVEYPRKGMWSFAFQTGDGVPEVTRRTGRDMVNIFIPTTPNPTSGFVLVVPRDEVVELAMSVDEGLQMILSIGVVVPQDRHPVLLDKRADAS
jgi:uncharacterized membrane protein